MSTITPEGDIAAWLDGQTFAAANIGTFNGTPATGTAPSLSIDGSNYRGSAEYVSSGLSYPDQVVSLSFYAADPASARVEYKLTYGDGSTVGTLSTQVIAYNSTQILTEGYGYTTNGAQYPGGFDSQTQSPAYYAVFSLTPLTAQDNAYYAGATIGSFNFPSSGNTPIPEPGSVAMIAVAVIAVVAARACRGLRGMVAAA